MKRATGRSSLLSTLSSRVAGSWNAVANSFQLTAGAEEEEEIEDWR